MPFNNNNSKPTLRAVPLKLFPTLGSLQEVVDLAESSLPITNRNELLSILYAYHNTLLNEVSKENNESTRKN